MNKKLLIHILIRDKIHFEHSERETLETLRQRFVLSLTALPFPTMRLRIRLLNHDWFATHTDLMYDRSLLQLICHLPFCHFLCNCF